MDHLNQLIGLDVALFQIINGWCGNWTTDRIAAYEEHNYLFKGGVIAAAYWWFWFAPDTRRRLANRQTIVFALIGTCLTLVLARALASTLPFRLRPMYTPDIGYRPPSLDMAYNMESWSSFPSDSAALWFALSFGLFRLNKPLGVLCMLFSAVWMCLARLYLGVHYPFDLVAGALMGVGVTWATVATLAARDDALGGPITAWLSAFEHRSPHWFYAAAFLLSFELTMIFDDVRTLVHGASHAFRAGGHTTIADGALFIVGGAFLAVGAAGWLGLRMGRRIRDRRTLHHPS